jgi:hypothetical protein
MHIDIVSTETWQTLGDELKNTFAGTLFPTEANVQLRAYRGAGHAAYEATESLMQVYAHKKNLAHVKGLTPVFDFLIAQFLKEAYQIQTVEHTGIKSPEIWVEQLKKDTNFVLLAEDHPITGEVFETETLDKLLNEKKIYSIRVSHARHFQVTEDVRPCSARILSFGPDLAITVYGTKFKAGGLTAPQMGWDKAGVIQKIQRKRKRVFDQSLVQNFENALSEFKYFANPVPRLYDRAVLSFPEVNGEALVQDIAQAMSLNKNLAEDLMSTTSQCSWEDPLSFKNWWIPAPTPEAFRGLVVFSAEILARKDFANLVKTSYDNIRSLQASFRA